MKRHAGLSRAIVLVGVSLLASGAWAYEIPIAHSSFDQYGSLIGGIEQGWWTGNGMDGYVWTEWMKYETSEARGGPYQTLNTLYDANTTYTLTFHAKLNSGSNGKLNAYFMYVLVGNAWYDGNFTGASTEVTLTSTDWTEFSLTYTTPASGTPVGSHIALYFSFPATEVATSILLDDVSLTTNSMPLGDPSFENNTMAGGFGQGWNNFGTGGWGDVPGYEGSWCRAGGAAGRAVSGDEPFL